MDRRMILVAIEGITLCAFAQVARAEWRICNLSGKNLSIAIAYANPNGGITSSGWWSAAACGGCATVLQSQETSDKSTVFLYAQTSDGIAFIQGGPTFCTSGGNFKYRQTRDCATRKSFREEHIDINKHFTTNINGKGCVD